jgi:hypothetical protein
MLRRLRWQGVLRVDKVGHHRFSAKNSSRRDALNDASSRSTLPIERGLSDTKHREHNERNSCSLKRCKRCGSIWAGNKSASRGGGTLRHVVSWVDADGERQQSVVPRTRSPVLGAASGSHASWHTRGACALVTEPKQTTSICDRTASAPAHASWKQRSKHC